MRNEIKYLASRLIEPLSRGAFWVENNKKKMKMVVAGAGLVVGNTLAGSVIYEQNKQIDRLRMGEMVLAGIVDNLNARLSITEQIQDSDAYDICRTAIAVQNGEINENTDNAICQNYAFSRALARPH